MRKNLLSNLTANLPLKIISVVIAIVIWYVVVDYNDPVDTKTYTVQVTVTNESYIANGKQSYRIEDEYKSVAVTLKANKSILKNIESEDITVTADLTEIVDLDRDPVMVPLHVSCPGVDGDNITLSRQTIPIVIETVASKEFAVSLDTGGTSPDKNYEVGALSSSVDIVTISGPESIIDEIESVAAVVDVTDMTSSARVQADLVLYDADMNKLSQTLIADSLYFDCGDSQIPVYVELWKRQAGIRLDISTVGQPADGYQVAGITSTPGEVTVVGTEAALQNLAEEGNTLTIPADRVSVKDATGDIQVEVQIDDLLQGDIRLASNMTNIITVYVTILQEDNKEFTLDMEDLQILNLNSSLTYSFNQTSVTLVVKGSEENLEKLDIANVSASIDLSGLTAGQYDIPAKITLPKGYTLVDNVTIHVTLKEKAENGGITASP